MEHALTPAELQRYKQRLLAEFAVHAAEVENLEATSLEPSGGSRFQQIDESIEAAELETDLIALDAEDGLGYEVHEALERITAGTFGTCETCGRAISRARLEFLPYARLCAHCARVGGF